MSARIDGLAPADVALIVTALAVTAPRLDDAESRGHCRYLAAALASGLIAVGHPALAPTKDPE
ncbi:hypothetical protein [Actinomadura rupiterrae]|uniref:hypothetical protein n=1 Tax=Actinomadura rupiterrae TaxID=559627 RepID=UPI0020A58A94|nr:hypothetical protein [Actinomadura rupiterrae]MCP2339224.1 hypothetical protein [Actinomadura rupiterrae]